MILLVCNSKHKTRVEEGGGTEINYTVNTNTIKNYSLEHQTLFSYHECSLYMMFIIHELDDSETERKISSSLLMPLLELGIFTDAIVRTWNIYHVYWCHC